MSDPFDIDLARVRRSFGRSARAYDAAAVLQKRVRDELLERLDVVRLEPHVVLDLGGVAFLWPVVQEQFYLQLGVTLTAENGLSIGFEADWGTQELADMGTTYILSDFGFALILLLALSALVFRKEFLAALSKAWSFVRSIPGLLRR